MTRLHEIVDLVGVELQQLEMTQNQGSDVNFVFGNAFVIFVVAVLKGRQEAGSS